VWIHPCAYTAAEPNNWYVEMTHAATGIPFGEADCPHFYTLAQAKSSIEESERQRNREARGAATA
jgi:hypothetical protein